jgi:hypothetical protein
MAKGNGQSGGAPIHGTEVHGTEASESLIGAGKPEILIGDLGDDVLTGGKGPDVFVFDAHRSDELLLLARFHIKSNLPVNLLVSWGR